MKIQVRQNIFRLVCGLLFFLSQTALHAQQPDNPSAPKTMADVMAAATDKDWRDLDPENVLYMDLASGRLVVELAPAFAPEHVENVKTLVRQKYFDGLSIIRSQDNYVAQWGDPGGKRDFGKAKQSLPPEFYREWDKKIPFFELKDGDVYAANVGLSAGMPVAGDRSKKKIWLAHCYAMLGAGRDTEPGSGSGAELYVVTGHSPRHLDKNVTLFGRVLQGMELLSTLPRGTGSLGFYESPEEYTAIKSIRVAADVLELKASRLQVMHTDSKTYAALVEARRNRTESWFVDPTGKVELCNMPIPVREKPAG